MSDDKKITVAELIIEARRLVGVPFIHQGRSMNSGVDCVGLFGMMFALRGIDLAQLMGLKDDVSYGRAATPFLLEATQLACKRLTGLCAGAALLFKMPHAAHPHHFALYTDTGTIIHAEALRKKQVIEQTYGRPWTRFLHSIWAIPGVEYPE